MKQYILALDAGTTSARSILFDKNRAVISVAQHEIPQIFPQAGWVEQNPMDIYASQYSSLTECIAKSGVSPDEIAGIGLKTDYQVRKNVGTKAYLEACLPEISRKLNEVRDRVKNGTASDEEKELINRYRPGQPAMDMNYGRICIEVVIKTPWYSIGENWGEDDMYRDLDRCKELFYKLIGYEDIMAFGYGV